jgi:hypothetical protein
MAIMVQGVCVGRKDETIEYTNKEGKPDKFRAISVSFAEADGVGDPVSVDVSENQLHQFQAFQQYKVPVEARTVQTKRGIVCRISMLKNGAIERLGQAGAPPRPENK